ncbi:MAG: single-stranded-DNA-specific exonuclease RecJ [Fusicatenibacter sp.]|nr:single-stranded-DNA-specific exonuclease RecJ [Lachnospiraceae bacterium]MDY2939311.1 single-stranded-DNA-specific exonuclease RecJ [Fusicatenibacter sp.]
MNGERWVVSAKRADFAEIAKKYGIDPVIARLIRNRDVIGDDAIQEYLYGNLDDLHNPLLMKDMEHAVEILAEKIREKKPIRIIGDYDIDGVMSTYILLTGLLELGADVDVKIPDRIVDGYGMNEHLVRQAAEDGRDTILTCDNGIAAIAQIALAKELGMTVVVTDHHEVPYEEAEGGQRRYLLPEADAVVNPKQKDCPYPFKGLCGAAVAWKLIQSLEAYCGYEKTYSYRFLEFVAIATIGDVMDLQGENRILVKEGLKALHRTENFGLAELIRVQGIEKEAVTPYHIGFVIGPCLNASGRLDTAERSLQLLLAKDQAQAAKLAGDLKNLNESRKELTRQGEEQAISIVESSTLKDDDVLVVYLPECHESLAGIIAGRLREHFHKPSFVITRCEEGVKGSGRSIEAYSMYEELCKCRELFTKFGGHPMAAGLSMESEEMVDRLRVELNRNSSLTEEDFYEKVTIDVAMPISYISKSLIHQMELLAPFGKGNTRPLFAQKGLTVLNCRIFGKNKNVVKMQLRDPGGYLMDGVYFGDGPKFVSYADTHPVMSLAYYPSIDSWNGRETLQITIQSYQ